MRLGMRVRVLMVLMLVAGIAGSVLAEVTPAQRKKLEAEKKALESKLAAQKQNSERKMKKRIKEIEASLEGPAEVEVGLSLDLASAYVYRGVTFNDGAVIQPGIEISGLPVTFGVWANFDIADYDGAVENGQFSEIDIYLSYDLPVDMGCVGASVGYTEYTYPSGGGDADREISLSLAADVILAPSISAYYGVDGGIDETLVVEAAVSQGFEITPAVGAEIGALVSYTAPGADDADSGLDRFELSASVGCGAIGLGITYVGQIDDDVLPDGAGAYDVEAIAVLSVAQSF